jgi:hypothetical protein
LECCSRRTAQRGSPSQPSAETSTRRGHLCHAPAAGRLDRRLRGRRRSGPALRHVRAAAAAAGGRRTEAHQIDSIERLEVGRDRDDDARLAASLAAAITAPQTDALLGLSANDFKSFISPLTARA